MRPLLATSVAALLLAAAVLGCWEEARSVPAARKLDLQHRKGVVGAGPREGLPTSRGGARVVSVPRFGTISWRCDTGRRPVRYAASLWIPADSATVTGTVKITASARTPFTVHPGDAVSTPATEARRLRWELRSDHKPAPRTLRVELRMGRVEPSGECVLLDASVRRAERRRR